MRSISLFTASQRQKRREAAAASGSDVHAEKGSPSLQCDRDAD